MDEKAARHRRITGRLAVIGLVLLITGCAANDSASNSDNQKNSGFYSGVAGGVTRP